MQNVLQSKTDVHACASYLCASEICIHAMCMNVLLISACIIMIYIAIVCIIIIMIIFFVQDVGKIYHRCIISVVKKEVITVMCMMVLCIAH